MPKATAVWLVENTTLTFEQIAKFCGMHLLEVQGIADGDVATGMIGINPVSKGLISKYNLDAAIKDPKVPLVLETDFNNYATKQKKVKNRYTPVARRQDKPDAIAWLLKNHPTITDAQIAKLIGTTKNTIKAIRDRSHWNMSNIKPRDPVLLGLCTQTGLFAIADKIEAANKLKEEKAAKEKAKKEKEKAKKAEEKQKKAASA